MEIIPLYRDKEEVKIEFKEPKIPKCPYPLKRWTMEEIKTISLDKKFIDTMKKLDYKETLQPDKLILRREVSMPEGKIIDEVTLSRKDEIFKFSKKELSIKTTVKIPVPIEKMRRISPHISESQINNINIGICKMKSGYWRRVAKCCDLSKVIR